MAAFFSNLVIQTISFLGYGGIFLLMVLESANIPIPSEIIMSFAGFLVFQNKFNFLLVILIGTIGNVFGSLLSYWFAEWILNLRNKFKFLHIILSTKHLHKTNQWFEKYGIYSVFIGRIVPIVRTFISLPAGIAKMNMVKFIFFTFCGSFLWSMFLTYSGFILGENWAMLSKYFHYIDIYLIFIVIIFIIFLVRKSYNKNLTNK
ncbi:MAG: DedA family protein [Minisyncoccia bacterium]